MQIIRNVFKRKLRVFLTISGITIGVFALVMMGGMAERINLIVSGGTKYYSDKVIVGAEGSNFFSTDALEYSLLEDIRAVSGVAEVQGEVTTLLEPGGGASFGPPPLVGGADWRGLGYESFQIKYGQGRAVQPGETGVVAVGSDLVKELNARLGGNVTIRGERFEVVGIMEPTLTLPDTSVYMSLSDAQEIYAEDVPAIYKNDDFDPFNLVTNFVVYPTPETDPDDLADAINAAVPGVEASGPSFFQEEIASTTQIFNYILYGVALISLFVGGLSVINTMTMSVSERTREIGMRKAIGASNAQIVGQFQAEAGIIGFIGGITGLFLGWIAATIVNKVLEAQSFTLFLITPRLAAGSVAFAIVLGLVAGFIPSLHAARMKPVDALRYE